MALQIKNYELPDGLILEEAYVRILKINTNNLDFEQLKPDGDNLVVDWQKRLENECVVYIYADVIARNNRVVPLHWFGLRFDLDLDSSMNIYTQAYNFLRKYFEQKGLEVTNV